MAERLLCLMAEPFHPVFYPQRIPFGEGLGNPPQGQRTPTPGVAGAATGLMRFKPPVDIGAGSDVKGIVGAANHVNPPAVIGGQAETIPGALRE